MLPLSILIRNQQMICVVSISFTLKMHTTPECYTADKIRSKHQVQGST